MVPPPTVNRNLIEGEPAKDLPSTGSHQLAPWGACFIMGSVPVRGFQSA